MKYNLSYKLGTLYRIKDYIKDLSFEIEKPEYDVVGLPGETILVLIEVSRGKRYDSIDFKFLFGDKFYYRKNINHEKFESWFEEV